MTDLAKTNERMSTIAAPDPLTVGDSEERLRQLVENVNDVFWLTNAEATGSPPLTESDRASVSQGRSFGVTATFNFH